MVKGNFLDWLWKAVPPFIWPCSAFLWPVLKFSGSQLSADSKKSRINWNLAELQAKTWKSTKILFGRNGDFQKLKKSWMPKKINKIQSKSIDRGIFWKLTLRIFICTQIFLIFCLMMLQKSLKTIKKNF